MKRFNCDFGSRFRILKGGKISLVVSAILSSATLVFASPTGGTVTSGTANISQSGNTTNITQSTNKATINWQDFSIKSNETVNFKQPNVNSITLNRVVGNERSVIDGALNANGQVWILNSNGILFNKDSKINTAGILATTKNISDADFNAGNYKFTGNSTAGVINMGTIEASDSGYVALLANTVQNNGTIKAYKGTVHLTGASEATINLNGNSIVSLTVNKGVLDALVENKGVVLADGGKIFLTTNAVDEILKGVVNNTGLIEANSLDDISGEVILFAHGGTANVSGTIEAIGGFVETSGNELSVASDTVIKAKKWLIDPVDVVIESTGGSDVAGSSISATAIETALESADVQIEATNDITVNDAINITQNNLKLIAGNDININANINVHTAQYYGLNLAAGNDINVNAIIDVSSQNVLGIFYGFNLETMTFNDTGHLNMGMNANKTAFTGKINLASDSVIYMNSFTTQSTIISDRAGLEAMDAYHAYYTSIGNPDQQAVENDIVTALAGKYVLGADIVLTADWSALGISDYSFTGVLNGLGHSIAGLTTPSSTQVSQGLFSSIEGGSVSNLALTNVNINVNGGFPNLYYGALAGNASHTTISNIILQGSINGTKDSSYTPSGGLVGNVYGTTIIDNVHANVDVEGSMYVGGLVGYGAGELTITNSSSKGNIKFANQGAGGLVGYFDGDSLIIEKSFNAGSIGAMADTTDYSLQDVGGLVGYLYSYDGHIRESFNMGSVSGTNSVGGIVGYLDSVLEITDTFNIGTVTAIGNTASRIGGFIGTVDGDIDILNSYNSGNVLKTATSSENVGGFIGSIETNNEVIISDSFNSGDVTGTTRVGGFIGRLMRGDDVELTNVSASGRVNGTTNVGGFIGQSGEVETEKIELVLTNVNWSSTASGQSNAIGSSIAPTLLVRLYDTEEDGSFYVSPNLNNTGGRYTTDVLGGERVAYNYDTHYAALVTNDVDGEYHKTSGTIKTGDFTNASNITTAQDGIITSAFTAPTWVKNSAINNGLPYFPWYELASTGGSTPVPNPEPTPTPVPNPEPTPTKQDPDIEKVITSIVNNTTTNVNVPKDILLPKVNLGQNTPILPMTPTIQASPVMQNLGKKLGLNQGEELSLVSTTLEGQATQRITLGELKDLTEGSNNPNERRNTSIETRVALGDNSIVELVNGGVTLPEGVDQEFYVTKNKKKQ
jgi:filamentous hemagglutinin family protein